MRDLDMARNPHYHRASAPAREFGNDKSPGLYENPGTRQCHLISVM
jgi:hypothetical protein